MSGPRPYRIVLRDAVEPSYLRWLWAAGSTLLSGADHRIAAGTWADARSKLRAAMLRLPPSVTHVELSVWGHGSEGVSYIGGERLDIDDVALLLETLYRPGVHVTVWYRQCDVLGGRSGHAFAAAHASRRVDVVGHCAVISLPWPWQQREVCGLRAGESPWWSLTGAELPACSAVQMSIRPEWFAPRAR